MIFKSIAMAGALCLALLHAASAQTLLGDEKELQAARSELLSIADSIGDKVTTAQDALRAARDSNDERATEESVNDYFDGIDAEVRKALQQVSINSPLMDEVAKAKQHAIILLRWLERQPSTHPNRDQQIARLEEYIADYDDQVSSIAETETATNQMLSSFGAMRGSVLMEAKISRIGDSLESLQQLNESLANLSNQLRTLAGMTVTDPSRPATVDQQ